MGLNKKKELERIREESQRNYEAYIKKFNVIKEKIESKYRDFDSIQNDIHEIRRKDIKKYINELYENMVKVGYVERKTAFDFKDDKISEKPSIEAKAGFEMPDSKKVLEISKYAEEYKDRLNFHLKELENELKFWEGFCKVVTTYRAVLEEIQYTIEKTLFPEFDGIEALLIADGVRACIVEDQDPNKAKPSKINWFNEQVTFFNNACNYYSFLCAFYEQTKIKDLYEKKNIDEMEKEVDIIKVDVEKRQNDLKRCSRFS